MTQSLDMLVKQAHQMCADPQLCSVVARHAGLDEGRHLDCTIHTDDQMLLHSLRHHQDANASFSQYYNVGLQQFRAFMQVWQLLGMEQLQPSAQVLDFACGYGRLLRFLVPALPEHSVYGAEIQTDALQFVKQQFSVPVWPSAYAPDEFSPEQSFDLVWVASLFSHLPDHLFTAWLGRLKDILSERGVLCFSVHDQLLLPDGQHMPDAGIRFFAASENADLDNRAYGTTYVTEAYVMAKVSELFGSAYSCQRIPRGLAHEQDLYVVAPRKVYDLQLLESFQYGPWGWVDERRCEAGKLYLRGWAAALDGETLKLVDIYLDGRLYRCPTGLPRPDVAQVFGRPQLAGSGWEFVLDLPGDKEQVLVEVHAKDLTGQSALLYIGYLTTGGTFVDKVL